MIYRIKRILKSLWRFVCEWSGPMLIVCILVAIISLLGLIAMEDVESRKEARIVKRLVFESDCRKSGKTPEHVTYSKTTILECN